MSNSDNPYAAPPMNFSPGSPLSEREHVAELLTRFSKSEVSGNEVISKLWNFDESSDPKIIMALQYLDLDEYCLDGGFIRCSNSQWNQLQRIRLLLSVSEPIQLATNNIWEWSQLPAAITLIGYVSLLFLIQINWLIALIGLFIAGLISIGLTFIPKQHRVAGTKPNAHYPFENQLQLRTAYELAQAFRRDRYPRALESIYAECQKQMSKKRRTVYSVWFITIWLLIAPMILLFQSMPYSYVSIKSIGPNPK